MKILFATTEFGDFTKSGGLGDVSAALPRALKRRDIDVRVLMPACQATIAKANSISIVASLPARAGIGPCLIGETRTPDGLILYLVLEPSLYQRGGSAYCNPQGHDWQDNDLRFGRFSLAAAELAKGRCGLDWEPDLLHVNDWPGGLAPAYLRWDGVSVPTVLTIHNIAHQGLFGRERIGALGIPERSFDMYGVEFHGRLSFLKAGMFYASHIATVSPRYAREIATEPLGGGLHGLVQTIAAEGRLSGILNGIDDSWNPGRDPHLPFHFDESDLSGKRAIADLVRASLCLRRSDGPLFGVVARLVYQKGLDILAEVADALVEHGGQIAILGLGDPHIEQMLGRLARRRRDDIALLNGFNETMARRIIAGSDFCLMPSRFEPCGLVQMQAQCYGSLPIAHATGGLADTIIDDRTGFLFSNYSAESLRNACCRAFDADADALARMRRAAMSRSFGWSKAAERYAELYSSILKGAPKGWRLSRVVTRSRAVEPMRQTLRHGEMGHFDTALIGKVQRFHMSPRPLSSISRDVG